MSDIEEPVTDKFTNFHLTRGHNTELPHGTYEAIVRLARPEYRPPYMHILGQFSPGFMRARIDYADFSRASADHEVLMVELRVHQSQAAETIQ